MVREVELYKKFTSTIATILLGTCMLFTLGVYVHQFIELNNGYFFLSRTRVEVTKEIDFEQITTNEVRYFLYRNATDGARDAGEENNFFIVQNVTQECEGRGVYLDEDPRRMRVIRDNIYNNYMVISEVYIGCIMAFMLFLAVFWIP